MNPFTEDNLVEKTVIKLIREVLVYYTYHIDNKYDME